MTIQHLYVQEIRKELGFTPTWLPNVHLDVGDVIALNADNSIERVSALQNFGVEIARRRSDAAADIEYVSAGAVSIHSKMRGTAPLAGSVLAEAEAGITVHFNRAAAMLLFMRRCQSEHLESLHDLSERILDLYNRGEWRSRYLVVAETIRAESSTLLLSASNRAEIEIGGDVRTPHEFLTAATATADVRRVRNLSFRLLAEGGLTPLIRVVGLKANWLGSMRLQTRSTESIRAEKRPLELRDSELVEVDANAMYSIA